MKRFPFQWVASGKQGGAALEMGGRHAARTGRTGAALPATRSVDAPLSRTGKCPAARTGKVDAMLPGAGSTTLPRNERYYVARNEKCYAAGSVAPVGHIPESNSATAIARLLYCQACFLPSCRTAESNCRITSSAAIVSSAVLLNLLYCQVFRKCGAHGFSADIFTM